MYGTGEPQIGTCCCGDMSRPGTHSKDVCQWREPVRQTGTATGGR